MSTATAVACLASALTYAGGPISPRPSSAHVGDAPVERTLRIEGDVTEIWQDGMEIIAKRLPDSEVVAMHLFIRGGVRNWPSSKDGVEELTLAAAVSGGSVRLSKEEFSRELRTMGSTLSAEAGCDFSVLRGEALRPHWSKTLDLLLESFLHPALPASEVDLQRSRLAAALASESDDPQAQVSVEARRRYFRHHRYERAPSGSRDILSALSLQDVRDHLEKLHELSRLVLVVVGDVEPSEVLARARAHLGGIPRGAYVETPLAPVRVDPGLAQVVEREIPTTWVMGLYPAPPWADPEFPTAALASSILGWRGLEEVRTRRKLAYVVSGVFSMSSGLPRGGILLATRDLPAAMGALRTEIMRLQTELVSEADLRGHKATLLTTLLLESESVVAQADRLGWAALLGNDWRLWRDLPGRIRDVSAQQVRAFARTHLARLRYTVIGNPASVDRRVFAAPRAVRASAVPSL